MPSSQLVAQNMNWLASLLSLNRIFLLKAPWFAFSINIFDGFIFVETHHAIHKYTSDIRPKLSHSNLIKCKITALCAPNMKYSIWVGLFQLFLLFYSADSMLINGTEILVRRAYVLMKFISIFSPWTIRLVDVHEIVMYLLVIINFIECKNNTSHIKWFTHFSTIKRSFSTCKTAQLNAFTFQKIALGRIVLEILHFFEIFWNFQIHQTKLNANSRYSLKCGW